MRELSANEMLIVNGGSYGLPAVLSWMTAVYAVEKKSDPLIALGMGWAAGVIAGLPDFLTGSSTLALDKLVAFAAGGSLVGTGVASYFSPLEKIYVVEADAPKA